MRVGGNGVSRRLIAIGVHVGRGGHVLLSQEILLSISICGQAVVVLRDSLQ